MSNPKSAWLYLLDYLRKPFKPKEEEELDKLYKLPSPEDKSKIYGEDLDD